MTKKDVLRKVLSVLSWLSIAYFTLQLVFGNLNTFYTILLIICYATFVLNIIVTIISKIIHFKQYKTFKDGYDSLKAVHRARYKLYFSSNKEKLNDYSEKIQEYGSSLLALGKLYIKNNTFEGEKMNEIREMTDKIQELMQKEFVTY